MRPHEEPSIVRATDADLPQLAQTLGHAFHDDPAMSWVMPDARRRQQRGSEYFEALLKHVYMPKGEVYMTPDHSAVALWGPPGDWQVKASAMLRLVPAMIRGLGRRVPVGLGMVNMMEARHKQQAEPHWYLAFVGTRPDRQGRGYGSALVRHILGRCDADGLPAYLEASAPRNRDLYLRHGFEVLEELHWPKGGPPFWPMWRPPGERR